MNTRNQIKPHLKDKKAALSSTHLTPTKFTFVRERVSPVASIREESRCTGLTRSALRLRSLWHRLHVVLAAGAGAAEEVVGGHDHEGHDDLGDHVEDGVGAHLERDREGSEALREKPHNGVADPGKREPGKLAVEQRELPTLSVSVGL